MTQPARPDGNGQEKAVRLLGLFPWLAIDDLDRGRLRRGKTGLFSRPSGLRVRRQLLSGDSRGTCWPV